MLKRIETVDFQVSEAGREDYCNCLKLFRQPQQFELFEEIESRKVYNLYVCRYGISTPVNY